MPNIESLPKWAQNRITELERDLAIADQSITVLTGDTPMDEAYVLVQADSTDKDMPFPRHTGVRFVLAPKTTQMHRAETLDAAVLTDRHGFRYLRLLGDRPMSVSPISTNGIEIRFQ